MKEIDFKIIVKDMSARIIKFHCTLHNVSPRLYNVCKWLFPVSFILDKRYPIFMKINIINEERRRKSNSYLFSQVIDKGRIAI